MTSFWKGPTGSLFIQMRTGSNGPTYTLPVQSWAGWEGSFDFWGYDHLKCGNTNKNQPVLPFDVFILRCNCLVQMQRHISDGLRNMHKTSTSHVPGISLSSKFCLTPSASSVFSAPIAPESNSSTWLYKTFFFFLKKGHEIFTVG